MSEVIYLSNVRLSFPHIAEPQRKVNEITGKERVSYNAEFLMPLDHAGYQAFMRRYGEMAMEKWKEHAQNVMTMIHRDRKQRCYGSGEDRINKKTFQPYDGYADGVFITAGRDTQPQIIQADGTPVDPSNTLACRQVVGKLYGGCRVNVALKPWLQDNDHGCGVRCDLIAIQFAGDDVAFGEGVVDASDMFGAVAGTTTPAPAAAPMPAAPFAAPVTGLPPFMS